jgi:hypothetical protein
VAPRWRGLRERELIVWLAEHDQDVVGIGTVGFSLTEIPWTVTGFAAEKQSLVDVAAAAQAKTRWEVLGYTPHEGILSWLAKFAQLIQRLTADHIDPCPARCRAWRNAPGGRASSAGFPCCVRHQVLLHSRGCIICNDLGE